MKNINNLKDKIALDLEINLRQFLYCLKFKKDISKARKSGKEEVDVSNLNLKGIWIPIEILTDMNLSDKEKIIYSIIMFLSKNNIPYLRKVKYSSSRKLGYFIQEKLKDNKYNNKNISNKYSNKQNCNEGKSNFEQRDYSGFDFSKLYMN